MKSAQLAANSGLFHLIEKKLAFPKIPNQTPRRGGICSESPANALSDINLHLTHSMKNDPNSNGPSGSIPDNPFPTNMLPPRLEAMVKSVAEVYHVPEVMPAAAALAIVSAAMGKGLRIASGPGRNTMGNLFFLISAGSGTGKSTILRALREPLDIIQKFHNELGSIEAIIRPGSADGGGFEGFEGFEGSVGLLPNPGKGSKGKRGRGADAAGGQLIRLICSEVTGQALAKMLEENQQVILNATAEAGNLLDEASRAASPLGQLLLKGYSGDHVEIDRIVRASVVIEEPCISLCWLCQPHRLEKFLASDRLLEDGLLARFLVAHSKATMARMTEHDAEVSVDVSDAYGALIEALFVEYGRNSKHQWTVDASHGAREVLRDHHNRCADRWNADCGPMRSCVARWTEQAWKITLVLHAGIHGANSHRLTVEADTAQRAVALQQWFACQQMRIIGGGVEHPENPRLARLCELLRESPACEMKLQKLKNSHGFSDDEIRRLVESAPMLLRIEKRKNPAGGPTSSVVGLIGQRS